MSPLGSVALRPLSLGKRRTPSLRPEVPAMLGTNGPSAGGLTLTAPGPGGQSSASWAPDRKVAKEQGLRPGAARTTSHPCKSSDSWQDPGLAWIGQRCRWGPWVMVSWALMVWMLPRIFF